MPKLTRKKLTVSPERLNFIQPMYARPVQHLPDKDAWAYESKLDGYRCLVGKDSTGVTLWSRRGNVLTRDFPLISQAAGYLPPDTLLDGELVAIDGNGRISFNLLQHHCSQAQAILFYAFDVIMHRGRSLRHVPLETRRELLADVIRDLKPSTPLICLSETIDATPAELIPLVKEFSLEA